MATKAYFQVYMFSIKTKEILYQSSWIDNLKDAHSLEDQLQENPNVFTRVKQRYMNNGQQ